MNDWPPVGIILLTCSRSVDSPRSEYARRTACRVLENLSYSGELRFHIADDGSVPDHVAGLVSVVSAQADQKSVSLTNSGGSGYGANFNLATQVVHQLCPVVLPLEDDWELTHPLNIDGYVAALMTGEVRSIRLGYIGFTQPLRGELAHIAGKTYLLFDPDSEEPHVNAGHPRLETVGYERAIGPWAEGLNPGATEMDWCSRREARIGVAWPMDAPPWSWFAHIGSVQAREDQREAVS